MKEFRPPQHASALRTLVGVILPLVLVVPFAVLAPVLLRVHHPRYEISGGTLTVASDDVWGSRTMRLADITDAETVRLGRGRRTSGTGLPGYCAGHFSYPNLGAVWQVTNCGGAAVVIHPSTEPAPVVLTPPDGAAFVGALRAGQDLTVELPPAELGPVKYLLFAVMALGFVTMLMVSALFLKGASSMRYVVGGGSLTVHTLFGTKRFSLAKTRARVHRPAALWRVAGAAIPGYLTGRFRESGQSVRVYATEAREVVLLEGAERLIVSPSDRAGFLEALRAEGCDATQ
jgi:hypothetical protein